MTLPGPTEWPVSDPIDGGVGDLLRERAQSSPDETAVIDADTGESWTYLEFDHRASDRTERIEHDVTPFDSRVALLMGTRPAFAEVAFAVSRRACSLVPLDANRDDATLSDQISRTGADVLVCESATESRGRSLAPDDVTVATVGEPRCDDLLGLRSDLAGRTWPIERSPEREHLVAFTSGTTGRPKGVSLTTANLVASANASAARLGVEPDDRWLVCLPMYHVGGFAPVIRSTLYGTAVVIQREFDAEATAAAMADYEVTCVSLVPTMLRRLLDADWTPPSSLRFVLLGGAPAGEDLIERCAERNLPVCPTYGTTETASQIATAPPREAFARPGTVGRPLRETAVAILDDGSPCDPGDVGEITVDGPTVTPGYLDGDETAKAFGPHGFETGDRGYLDEDGRLWVVGRVDDRIVTGGENVSPERVADVLRAHEAVDDAVVLGLDDPEWGQRVGALVERVGTTVDEKVVLSHCHDRLADYEVPKTVRFVESLPRTRSGTVDRERARDRLEG